MGSVNIPSIHSEESDLAWAAWVYGLEKVLGSVVTTAVPLPLLSVLDDWVACAFKMHYVVLRHRPSDLWFVEGRSPVPASPIDGITGPVVPCQLACVSNVSGVLSFLSSSVYMVRGQSKHFINTNSA